jgi:hypothetical protein
MIPTLLSNSLLRVAHYCLIFAGNTSSGMHIPEKSIAVRIGAELDPFLKKAPLDRLVVSPGPSTLSHYARIVSHHG